MKRVISLAAALCILLSFFTFVNAASPSDAAELTFLVEDAKYMTVGEEFTVYLYSEEIATAFKTGDFIINYDTEKIILKKIGTTAKTNFI